MFLFHVFIISTNLKMLIYGWLVRKKKTNKKGENLN